ncbi:hypothetical protein CK203_033983 [Vitis vinifera]|uniref:Uncharacterized protein n=1 Tax=Vitis vinifera TaxID=29760 RepID=A0A438HTX5_VITVI|nr:hypothetical protein CK203_033983 [Vitis vinifera]
MSIKEAHLQSNLTSDPFSVLKVNLSPARNSSTVKSSDKQSDQIDNGKELSFSAKLKSVILEGDDIAVANKSSHEVVHVITGDSTPPFEKAVNNDSRRLGVGINSGTNELEDNSSTVKSSDKQSDQIDNGKELSFSAKLKSVILDDIAVANKSSHEVVHVITGDSTPPSEKAVNNDSRRLGVGINSGLSGSHADLDGNIRSNNVDDLRRLDADTDVQINRTNELEDKEAEPRAHPDQNIEDSTLEQLNSSESQGALISISACHFVLSLARSELPLQQSRCPEGRSTNSAVVEAHDMDGPSKTGDDDPEQCTEEINVSGRYCKDLCYFPNDGLVNLCSDSICFGFSYATEILEPSGESLNKRSKEKHLLTENAKERNFWEAKSCRGWNIVEFWGEAKHQNQNETLGVLERRKVFVWTRT